MKLQMFTKHVNQLTIYISNHYGVYPQLINVVCQLYFNKGGKKCKKKEPLIVSHFIQEGKQIHNFFLALFIMQGKTKG